MNNLIDKLERADGPDRELDAEIAVATKLGCRPNLSDDLEYLSLPNKHDRGPGVTAGNYWFHCRSGMSLRSAPAYTASIDAAMTLLPDGAEWTLSVVAYEPCLVTISSGDDRKDATHALAKTPAIAIVLAALRARSQGGE